VQRDDVIDVFVLRVKARAREGYKGGAREQRGKTKKERRNSKEKSKKAGGGASTTSQ
jgi:hypothetical protein